MKLKSLLKCENLNKTLVQGAQKEDYEMLAKVIRVFSDDKIVVDDAYACMDNYCKETGESRYEMFLKLIEEISAAGFFKQRLTLKQIREQAEASDIDLDDLTEEALKAFKGEAMQEFVKEMMSAKANTTPTGVTESMTSDQPLMSLV